MSSYLCIEGRATYAAEFKGWHQRSQLILPDFGEMLEFPDGPLYTEVADQHRPHYERICAQPLPHGSEQTLDWWIEEQTATSASVRFDSSLRDRSLSDLPMLERYLEHIATESLDSGTFIARGGSFFTSPDDHRHVLYVWSGEKWMKGAVEAFTPIEAKAP